MTYNLNRELLNNLVSAAGASVDEVANKMDIPSPTLHSYLYGKANPGIYNIMKMADYFMVPIDALVGRWTVEQCNDILEHYSENFMKLRTKSYEDYIFKTFGANTGRPIDISYSKSAYETPWPYNLVGILAQEDCKSILSDDQLYGLEYALSLLVDRERAILLRYYKDGKTMTKIAKEYDITTARIQQIISKACRKLRNPMRMNYIIYGYEGNAIRNDITSYGMERDRLQDEIEAMKKVLGDLDAEYQDRVEKYKEAVNNEIADIADVLNIGVRPYNCLKRAGIKSIVDLHDAIVSGRFIKIINFGRKSAEEVLSALYSQFKIDYFSEYFASLGN